MTEGQLDLFGSSGWIWGCLHEELINPDDWLDIEVDPD